MPMYCDNKNLLFTVSGNSGLDLKMSSSVRKLATNYEEATDDEVEERVTINYIDTITEHGIGAADVKKLREANYHTVQSIIMSTKKDLTSVKGLSDAKVEKILEACHKILDVCSQLPS